ncbi:PREDICTED: uncharacterized protein LOC109171684 [Ipomoea nil]|uniref:uncharacterized protein LOC109171684 n=1 Tax=Ipomoea nil TaxID=35883 RepID=UPI000900EC03|nr:PREDICTED: uncharacterized protein LOC109171684 [Ipomoea nil]
MLVEEIIAIVIAEYLEFIRHLSIEDTSHILDMENESEALPASIPPPANENKVRAFLKYFREQALAWESAHQQAREQDREDTQQRIQTLYSRTEKCKRRWNPKVSISQG